MRALIFLLLVIGLFSKVSAQESDGGITIVSHQVKQGETIRMISVKYLVTPSDIYKLNKFAIDGISQGMVLQIPTRQKSAEPIRPDTPIPENDVPTAESLIPSGKSSSPIADAATVDSASTVVSHKVAPKETLYSISKKYNTSVNELNKLNPTLMARGLQAGQVIKVKPN